MAAADPLARDLAVILRPILGPASEKAELLVEHLRTLHKLPPAPPPRGLADAARRLRAQLNADQIRAGARSLVASLEALYCSRETVV